MKVGRILLVVVLLLSFSLGLYLGYTSARQTTPVAKNPVEEYLMEHYGVSSIEQLIAKYRTEILSIMPVEVEAGQYLSINEPTLSGRIVSNNAKVISTIGPVLLSSSAVLIVSLVTLFNLIRGRRKELVLVLIIMLAGLTSGISIGQVLAQSTTQRTWISAYTRGDWDVLVFRDGDYAVAVDEQWNVIAKSTDHASVIQAAIDRLGTECGKILLKSGVYDIWVKNGAGIYVSGAVEIAGEGINSTVLRVWIADVADIDTDDLNGLVFKHRNEKIQFFYLHDLTIDGNRFSYIHMWDSLPYRNRYTAIEFRDYVERAIFERVEFKEVLAGTCIGAGGSEYIIVRDCYFHDCGDDDLGQYCDALASGEGEYCIISRNIFKRLTDSAAAFGNKKKAIVKGNIGVGLGSFCYPYGTNGQIEITDNIVHDCGALIKFTASANSILISNNIVFCDYTERPESLVGKAIQITTTPYNIKNIVVAANVIHNVQGEPIWIQGAELVKVIGNVINGKPDGGGGGIRTLACKDAIIAENIIKDVEWRGIYVGSATINSTTYRFGHAKIRGNILHQETENTFEWMIAVGSTDYAEIYGNSFIGKPRVGKILIGDGVTKYIIRENEGYVTENSGTTFNLKDGSFIPHGLIGTPTNVILTCLNATYGGVPVIVSWNKALTNRTHIAVNIFWANGTAITDPVIAIAWRAEYNP